MSFLFNDQEIGNDDGEHPDESLMAMMKMIMTRRRRWRDYGFH